MALRRFLQVFVILFFWGWLASPARALTPDEIVLVVNKNIPVSVRLGEYYARMRNVPADHIIALNLPAGEELTFDRYERDVVPPIRQFLRKNHLEQKITCLLTFYGVPFRIGSRVATPRDLVEVGALKEELNGVLAQIRPEVLALEKRAKEMDPDFIAGAGEDLEHLGKRADEAARFINSRLPSLADAESRQAAIAALFGAMEKFSGSVGVIERFDGIDPADIEKLRRPTTAPITASTKTSATTQPTKWSSLRFAVEATKRQFVELQDQRFDPGAREKVRELVRENMGLFKYANLLDGQILYLSESDTLSALDNELALLWWDYYPRNKWQLNTRNYRFHGKTVPLPLMVMRLDGPQEGTASEIIITSMKAEKDGLKGCVAIDRGGAQFIDPSGTKEGYHAFETTLTSLIEIIHNKTKLALVQDSKPTVFPAHSVPNVALYCGWYRLRDYVPGMTFRPGAVGYHVASLEMVGLHSDRETGWVHGLLSDGIAATLGAVAEPYLHSFPVPDDFFPLLMTGKLTLAEVYWDTTPLTSWMICMIGDPLYTPYKVNPPMAVEDLPERLQVIFGVATTQPATTRPEIPPATLPASQEPSH